MFISLEELDDFSDSGSDFEATMKAKKRPKPAVPGPLVSYLILSQNESRVYSVFRLLTREYVRAITLSKFGIFHFI